MRARILLAAGVVALASLAFPAVVANADTGSEPEVASAVETQALSTAELISAVDPTGLDPVDTTVKAGELVSDQGDVEVALPTGPAAPLSVVNDAGSISVSIPGAGDPKITGESVVVEGALPATDVAVQAVDGGARQVYVLADSTAATSISFNVGSDTPVSITTNDNGSLDVRTADGTSLAGINAPWAVDATGSALPTSFEINGSLVTQHVDTTGAHFPVTADPTICGNKIDRVDRIRRDGGWTLSVRPTGCGRWWNGWDGWIEAQRESGRWYSGSQGRAMWNQYICHFDWAPWKSTWNLDEWRPDVGYWTTVRRACNP